MLASCGAAMLLIGAVGAIAVHESTHDVDVLSQELSPAQVANARFMAAMLDAETELRAYLISGEEAQLADHRSALRRVRAAQTDLATYARSYPGSADDVAEQESRSAAWIADFAVKAIAEGPGRADDDRALFDLGVSRFDAVKSVNQEIGARLADQVAEAGDAARSRLSATVALIALIGVVAAITCGFVGWRLLRGIREPLSALERVVDRLAAGELDVRAEVAGATEIRRLGGAVNDLAQEVSRARDMELRVHESLMDADRLKSEFVANVSHELRTPLTSIDGYLELLHEDLDGTLDVEHAEMMTVMQRNVVRLRSLIEDLLDLGRVERHPATLTEVDLAGVVCAVAQDLRLSAGSRAVTISTDLGDDSPLVVHADATQLHRAMTNLVSNAVKFSHNGGEVELHLDASAETVEITVVDHGIGIPVPDQAKLGERFFRASNAVAAQVPGTGLGLRMVQTIVDNHRGSFALSSHEGQGTTATVRLPRPRTEHTAAPLR